MTPTSFTFHISVPRDALSAPIVQGLAAHAVTYTKMDAASGRAFVERVAVASDRAMSAQFGSCAVEFVCADGELRVLIDGETVRQSLTA